MTKDVGKFVLQPGVGPQGSSQTRRKSSSTHLSPLDKDNGSSQQFNAEQIRFLTAPPSALSPEAQVNGQKLHGQPAPRYELKEELPWHRSAAYLFACGTVTIKDVAEACGVDPATVTNLLRQTWFQERVTSLMSQHGGRDIMDLFRAEQFNSLVTLIEIRDDGNASKRDRLTSAINILDRTLGKPTQPIDDGRAKSLSADPVAEVQRLEQALGDSVSSYHPGEIPEP